MIRPYSARTFQTVFSLRRWLLTGGLEAPWGRDNSCQASDAKIKFSTPAWFCQEPGAWPEVLTSQRWVSISFFTNKRPSCTGSRRALPVKIHSPIGRRNFLTGAWVERPAQPPISCVTSGNLLSFSELVSISVKCLFLWVL